MSSRFDDPYISNLRALESRRLEVEQRRIRQPVVISQNPEQVETLQEFLEVVQSN
jgi:hypothetical protein